jgi:hypothetical protein
MLTVRIAAACLALIGAFHAAIAEPARGDCQDEDAIPEFVTQRIDLVSALARSEPMAVTIGDLEPDPVCRRGAGGAP